jgi:hypothetical protein
MHGSNLLPLRTLQEPSLSKSQTKGSFVWFFLFTHNRNQRRKGLIREEEEERMDKER